MMHTSRRWSVASVESAEQLAHHLTEMTWCGCSGFELDGYLFLNDATSADGAQEYAILKQVAEGMIQIESVTFSWCCYDQALRLIRQVVDGQYDDQRIYSVVAPQIETPEAHGRCHLCA